jgi:putative SOS response-associated peptidase YedK
MDRQGRPNEPQLVYRRDPDMGQPVEGLLRWGLIPHFCETRPDFEPIHARAETVVQKEWFQGRLSQAPLHSADEQLLSEGHRWEALRNLTSRRPAFRCRGDMGKLARSADRQVERTFAVVTVPANELVAQIHDRMLAILPNDRFSRWLSKEADPRELLVPFPADELAVSPQRSRR